MPLWPFYYGYAKANQLVSSTTGGKTTDYSYDAAGRLTKEGDKAYSYGWLDKVLNITQNGKVTNSYSYGMDGQIATATAYGSSSAKATGGQETESFIWDGLALLKRDTTEYVNEPAVTGGNPILANGKGLFNDMLGTTLGKYDGKKFIDNQRTSFGSGSREGFFTGKPHIAGLGYAFLFRNYRSELGKWQTQDPLGYPDGWNNLAYCNNVVTTRLDPLGLTNVKTYSGSISIVADGYPKYSEWSDWELINISYYTGAETWKRTRTVTTKYDVYSYTATVDDSYTLVDGAVVGIVMGGVQLFAKAAAAAGTTLGWGALAVAVVDYGLDNNPQNLVNIDVSDTSSSSYSLSHTESETYTGFSKPE